MITNIQIPTDDGSFVAATLWSSKESQGNVVIIQAATGVKRAYYRPFAEYLHRHGLSVLTFDYRGVGDSRPADGLRGFFATMVDWAVLDAEGALKWIKREFPESRIHVIGHSFGGHALGLMPSTPLIDKALLVGAGSGYWRLFNMKDRRHLAFMWHLLVPVTSWLIGYFPAKWLGLGEDLPKGVALQWARWCRTEDYFADDLPLNPRQGFRGLSGPIRMVGSTSDSFATPDAVRAMARMIFADRLDLQIFEAERYGITRMDHFDFFRPTVEQTFWSEIKNWLKQPAVRAVRPASVSVSDQAAV